MPITIFNKQAIEKYMSINLSVNSIVETYLEDKLQLKKTNKPAQI